MTELDDRLRSGLIALAERVEPAASTDEVIAQLDRPARRSTGIALRVAVAAALVLVVAATVVVLRRDGDQAVVDVGPSPTTIAPKPEWRPDGTLAPGWNDLPIGPLGAMSPRAMVWTGSALIVWRGESTTGGKMDGAASFDPASSTWTELPPDPLDTYYLSGVGAGGAWTGQEALFWAPEGMAAWNPSTGSWRQPTPPRPTTRDGVWTGSEVLFWADGLAYDSRADLWREIARPSEFLVAAVNDDAQPLLLTGEELVVVGALSGSYNLASDSWREFGVPLSQEAGSPGFVWDSFTATVVEMDGQIVAFDASPSSAAVLDVQKGMWTEVPELVPEFDPSPAVKVVPFDDGQILFMAYDDESMLRTADGRWIRYPVPPPDGVVGTGEFVFQYGTRDAGASFSIFVPPTPLPWDPASLGPGWHEFDRGPLPSDRSPQAAAYNGRTSELHLFGFRGSDEITENYGYTLDLRTQEWSEIPAAPLGALDGLDGMWDGESFVVWSQGGVAFWDPASESWRAGAPPPRSLERQIWVPGNPARAAPELLFWADGLAYDMQRDEWREIARPPSVPTRSAAAYNSDELFVVGLGDEQAPRVTAQYAYDLTSDSWRELPPTGLDGQEVDLLWLGQDRTASILGVDYQGGAAVYDTDANQWRRIDSVPLDFGEGSVQLARISQGAFLSSTWGFAQLDQELRWRTVSSDFTPGGIPVTVDFGVFVIGDRIALYVP